MSKYVGTWVYDTTSSQGDLAHLMRTEVLPDGVNGWGTVVGLGWAPILRVIKVGVPGLFLTVAGAWEANASNPESTTLFQVGAWPTLVPAVSTTIVRVGQDYEATQILVHPSGTERAVIGADGMAEVFAFRVERTP
jgi:hypothetical protein